MIGQLPETVSINGRDVAINTDFRRALIVLQAFADPELTNRERAAIMLDALIGLENVNPGEEQEALERCVWFIDCGHKFDQNKPRKKLMDWEQDEQLIFSAVNHVAGTETRALPYLHWWTFIGYFNEIHDGLFSTVLMIRQKKAKGKKLEKSEREFYQQNKDMVDIKTKISEEEQAEIDRLNEIYQ